MGVFEFIILLVLISTVGKVIAQRQPSPRLPPAPPAPEEVRQLEDSMSLLSARLEKLEEERDFYRALLDPPDRAAPRLSSDAPGTSAEGDGGTP